jgi:hypothetical protein
VPTPSPDEWHVWFYRENIGWWRETAEPVSRAFAPMLVRKMFWQHKDDEPTKYAYLVLPAGKKPSDVRASFSH